MHRSAVCITLALVWLFLALGARPSFAWLYDGGPETISGAIVSETSGTKWAAEPFTVAQNSYATSFGAAITRGVGVDGMGYDLYLSDTLTDITGHGTYLGTICPTSPTFTYKFAFPASSVRLDAGKLYFLALMPNSGNFLGSVSWSYVNGAYFAVGSHDYGATWGQMALPISVRVDGYAVPEPQSWLSVLLGLSGAAAILRRSRGSRLAAGRA